MENHLIPKNKGFNSKYGRKIFWHHSFLNIFYEKFERKYIFDLLN